MSNFSGWRRWDKELGDLNDLQTKHKSSIVEAVNTVFDQITYDEDVPPDSDLAEFMKTAKHNVIYRVSPNTNVKNTCIGNNAYSFYTLEGPFIAGYDTAHNKYLLNFTNKVFTYWRRVMEETLFLHQLGLANEDFSDTDFVANLYLLSNAMGNYNRRLNIRVTASRDPRLYASILQRLKDDNVCDLVGNNNVYFTLKIDGSDYNVNDHSKIELFTDVNTGDYRSSTIVAYCNRDGVNRMWFSGFRQAAYIEKPLEEIELLNGWEIYAVPLQVTKIGNYVHMDFAMDKGIRKSGTQIFILPERFRPQKSIKGCPILTYGSGDSLTRISVRKDGIVTLDGADNTTGHMVFGGGFTI